MLCAGAVRRGRRNDARKLSAHIRAQLQTAATCKARKTHSASSPAPLQSADTPWQSGDTACRPACTSEHYFTSDNSSTNQPAHQLHCEVRLLGAVSQEGVAVLVLKQVEQVRAARGQTVEGYVSRRLGAMQALQQAAWRQRRSWDSPRSPRQPTSSSTTKRRAATEQGSTTQRAATAQGSTSGMSRYRSSFMPKQSW